jgi:hypothetical protein
MLRRCGCYKEGRWKASKTSFLCELVQSKVLPHIQDRPVLDFDFGLWVYSTIEEASQEALKGFTDFFDTGVDSSG